MFTNLDIKNLIIEFHRVLNNSEESSTSSPDDISHLKEKNWFIAEQESGNVV